MTTAHTATITEAEAGESPQARDDAALKAKYDPYKVGRIYTFEQLLHDHQNEVKRWYNAEELKGLGIKFMRVNIPVTTMLHHHGPWVKYDKAKPEDKKRIDGFIAALANGGVCRPLLVDEDYDLLEGQHRIQGLIKIGKKVVPAIYMMGTASALERHFLHRMKPRTS